jgi:hypothetical protein
LPSLKITCRSNEEAKEWIDNLTSIGVKSLNLSGSTESFTSHAPEQPKVARKTANSTSDSYVS